MSALRRTGLLLAGALSLLTAMACTPQTGSTDTSKGNIEITYTIRGVAHEETHPAAPGGQSDYHVPLAVKDGAIASVTADQTTAGFLSCQITYVNPLNGLLYIIDYAHDSKPGSVTCRADHQKIAYWLQHGNGKKIPPNQPANCHCEPDTLTLNVTWLRR